MHNSSHLFVLADRPGLCKQFARCFELSRVDWMSLEQKLGCTVHAESAESWWCLVATDSNEMQ